MNTQKAIVVLAVLILATLAGLFALANRGNVWAIVALSVIGTTVLITLGYGLAILQQHLAGSQEQKRFLANQRENQALIQGQAANILAMQKAQNAQNAGLMQQLGAAARLPQPGQAAPLAGLLFEDAVFSELESGE